jgi:SepF-like predicted cell division protein (DUF552 family)
VTHENEWIRNTLQELRELCRDRSPQHVTLDEVGTVIGDAAVTSVDIDLLFSHLEAENILVLELSQVDLPDLLRKVLTAARELRSEGVRPDKRRIAERSGLETGAVHVALIYADVLRG